MERGWGLKRPDVIITVTGGAMAFDMSTEDKDKIMKGMMDGTRNLDAWFITGGTKSGIMEVGLPHRLPGFASTYCQLAAGLGLAAGQGVFGVKE